MGQSTSKFTQIVEPLVNVSDQISSYDRPLFTSVLEDIDAQLHSPLYGRLPREIRDAIFKFTIAESIDPALSRYLPAPKFLAFYINRSHPRHRYVRRTKVRFTLALLFTCRRTYLETYHLPIEIKEHVFYRPRLIAPPDLRSSTSVEAYFQRFDKQQLQFLTRIHIFAHQLFLEDGSFTAICKLDVMQGIQKLKITMRYCDWWEWEKSSKMEMNPWGKSLHFPSDGTRKAYLTSLKEQAWGFSLQHMASLQELEMELESLGDWKRELDAIVRRAKSWDFPMSGDRVLSSRGLLDRRGWRESPDCARTTLCSECPGKEENCNGCIGGPLRGDMGLGPVLYNVVLRWRIT